MRYHVCGGGAFVTLILESITPFWFKKKNETGENGGSELGYYFH